MKKLLLVTLILFSIFKAEAQCGSFPLSVSVPTLTCASPTGTVVITTTVSPVSCVWQGPGIVSGGNTLNPVVNVGGIYAFTITNTTNGCNAVYNINVQSPLNVTSPWLSCSTTTAVMYSNPSFTPTSYLWTGPGIVSSNTTNTITVNATGYYICTISNTVTGCQVSGSGSVGSNTFVPTITCNNSTINCTNPATNLIASSPSFSPALLNFSWQGSGIIAGATTQTATINAAGVYTCFVTNTLNGCVTYTTGTVVSNTTSPSVMISSSSNPICAGQTTTLSTSVSPSTVIYSWSPSIGLNSTTDPSVIASPASSTAYTVTVTDISNGCSSSANTVVNVLPNPTVTVNSTTICSATSATLIANSSASFPSYAWSDGSAMPSIVVNPTITTNYSVTVTDGNGCASTATTNVTVGTILYTVSNATLDCNNPSISISLTATTTVGSITYSWNGPNIASGSTTAHPVVTGPGYYTFTLTNTGNVCTTTGSVLVISNTVSPSIVINSATVCAGTSAILSPTVSPITANSFSWSPSNGLNSTTTASVSANPTSSIVYTLTVTDAANGCFSIITTNVSVNQTCQDVWPGDANSDGVVDNLDVLELGLHYTLTGTPRATTDNIWQSYYASNWSGTITNGKNVNHSNCNGDGIINDDDTLAIYNNYSLNHAFKPTQLTNNPQLTIVPDQSSVAKGTWGTSSIYLADVATPINTINGLAFTVNFDNTLIDPNSIYLDYQNSFIDASHQNLYFRKLTFSSGKIYTATTHTVNNNVSGFGKIATLHYKILSSLNTDQVFNVSLTNANQSSALGIITPLTSGTNTLMAIGASVGLEENSSINSINISPNPTNGLVTIKSKLVLEKIEVVNMTGQLIINESVHSNNHILHLDGLVNGVYFLNIYQDNHIVKREKVIVSR